MTVMTTFIQEQPRELDQAHSAVMSEFDKAIAELRAANDWLRKHDEEPDFLSEELLEARYERNLAGWLGRFITKPQKISPYDLDALVARHESGSLTDDELREIENADFLLEGRQPGTGNVSLAAVEVSWVIDADDIDRAARRRDILRKAGYEAMAVVGGYEVHADIQALAGERGVSIDLRQPAR